MSAIECHQLAKSYSGRPALHGLDLEIGSGAVVGLLGPNGAGKTTAIRILSTIVTADSGTYSVAGFPADRPAELRRRIGVLPESAGYPEAQTGHQVLVFHARMFGQAKTEAMQTSRRLAAQVGLAERSDSLVAGYSRGTRQRLGIARALVNKPEVVFLDEPTLGLDPAGQRDVLQLIGAVARDHGATVVLSTHLLAEVEEICDRVIILNRGRAVADGTVRDVTQQVAAPRRGHVRLAGSATEAALTTLAQEPSVAAARPGLAPDEVQIELVEGIPVERGAAIVVQTLLAHGVPVVGFEFERARLSDAYLTLTADP